MPTELDQLNQDQLNQLDGLRFAAAQIPPLHIAVGATAGPVNNPSIFRSDSFRVESQDTSESDVVGEAGIEPTTPGLEGRCSIQLSYSPGRDLLARLTIIVASNPSRGHGQRESGLLQRRLVPRPPWNRCP